MLNGRCLCGAVRFTVEDAFAYALFCHCSACRQRSGSAFSSLGGIGIDKMQVSSGHDNLLLDGENNDGYRALCGKCYAPLFSAVRERKYVHVNLGALLDTPTVRPDHHIHVASKAWWYEITDKLPQHAVFPPGPETGT